MNVGLVIYGSLDTMSGGYLYDRMLVEYLRSQGDEVQVISIPSASYLSHLLHGLSFRLPSGLDIMIEDELVHPSLLFANRGPRHTPVVSLVHNLHSSECRAAWKNALFRLIERFYLASADGYIFNSAATQDSVQHLVGDRKPHVLAAPGGDRLGSLDLETVQHRALAPGHLHLLFLANVTPLKGLHILLDALSNVPVSTCSLDVAGSLSVDAPYAARMQRLARDLPVAVAFHGLLDGQPLAEMLRRSDVLVVPSFYEGFGISYLEGMAFGLPAIGTTAGAIPQMIHDGMNGYVIAPGDAAALAAIITRLSSDRQLLVHLSTGALESFQLAPTWEQSVESVRRFLLEMNSSARLRHHQ